MHPLVTAAAFLGGAGVLAFVAWTAFDIFVQQEQEREREKAYWGFREGSAQWQQEDYQAAPEGLVQALIQDVENRLVRLRRLPAGETRRREVRKLRAEFHPDRCCNSNSPLQPIYEQLSRIINTRTEGMD